MKILSTTEGFNFTKVLPALLRSDFLIEAVTGDGARLDFLDDFAETPFCLISVKTSFSLSVRSITVFVGSFRFGDENGLGIGIGVNRFGVSSCGSL